MRTMQMLIVASSLTASMSGFAEDKPVGYLCCNMRTDGSWISDINYDEHSKTVIPAGTPIKVTGYGRYRVKVDVNGRSQAIGNDYSRDLALDVFAKRYVVADNVAAKIAAFPRKVQDAIGTARIIMGMTREQVMMSVGYPVSSENHNFDDKTWRFWLTSFGEFHVNFDDSGHVVDVTGDADTVSKVFIN
jgi:hypothetical protein